MNAYYVSPMLLFKEMVRAGRMFLDEKPKLKVDIATEGDFEFETSDRIGAPWTVTFKNSSLQDIDIDFVPAIMLSTEKLVNPELKERLKFIRSRFPTERERAIQSS